MLVMRFADVQRPAPPSLLRHFAAQYKSLVIIIIIIITLLKRTQMIIIYRTSVVVSFDNL